MEVYNRHKTTRYQRIVEQDDEKLGELGHGTFGVVYKAEDQVSKVNGGHGVVAVKRMEWKKVQRQVPDPREFMRQFKLERQTMKKCDSRYIVKYLDYYQANKNLYFVMEYCPGGNLSDFISQNGGTLKQTVARYFSGQISEALVYMKSMDIVHRDLKPENIVLTESTDKATLKITDFGTAKFKRYDANTGGTVLKTFAGTPGYIAPEIMFKKGVSDDQVYDSSGNVQLSFSLSLLFIGSYLRIVSDHVVWSLAVHSVDLWSFGMIIYKMTTGSLELKVKQRLFGRISAQVFDHVDISAEGRNLLTGLLQRNPKDRKWEILKTNQWPTTDITNLTQTGFVNMPIEFFICPLSKQIMRDPVIAFDGNTYERLDIEQYLKQKGMSPVTGEKAAHSTVIPNNAMKTQIELFLKANKQQ